MSDIFAEIFMKFKRLNEINRSACARMTKTSKWLKPASFSHFLVHYSTPHPSFALQNPPSPRGEGFRLLVVDRLFQQFEAERN